MRTGGEKGKGRRNLERFGGEGGDKSVPEGGKTDLFLFMIEAEKAEKKRVGR